MMCGTRVQNRQATRTRPYNSETKRTDRSPWKNHRPLTYELRAS